MLVPANDFRPIEITLAGTFKLPTLTEQFRKAPSPIYFRVSGNVKSPVISARLLKALSTIPTIPVKFIATAPSLPANNHLLLPPRTLFPYESV
jgi:hypothetical protein